MDQKSIMDQEMLAKAAELTLKLQSKRDGNPGSFFGPIDDVGDLEREFVEAVAKGSLEDPQGVAKVIAELGTLATSQLVDEPAAPAVV